LMQELLPALTTYTDDLAKAARETGGFKREMEAAANVGKMILTAMIAVPAAVTVAGDSIGKLFAAMSKLQESADWRKFAVSPIWGMVDMIRKGGDEALAILKDDGRDMASVIEETVRRINAIWATAATGPGRNGGASGDEGDGRPKATPQEDRFDPVLAEPNLQNAILMADIEGFTAREEAEKAYQAARIEALIAAHEWEEEEAYRHGQKILDIDKAIKAQQEQRERDFQKGREALFAQATSLMNTESKKMFKIGKIAALSEAAIKGHQAVIDAYEWGTRFGGPVCGAAAAAVAAAATLYLMNIIRNQQFGGCGGGGTPVAPGQGSSGIVTSAFTAGGSVQRHVVINLLGSRFADSD